MLKSEDWENRWSEGETPWDLQGTTPALVSWSKTAELRGKPVLVPGCGRGHDAHFLAKQGARVVALDYAPSALAEARALYPNSRVEWRSEDVTALTYREEFSHAWEYTCFCALMPNQRALYLSRIAASLCEGGLYWGMVFEKTVKPEGPPFAVEPSEFRALLEFEFEIQSFESPTARSVKPRLGNEIWFEAIKRGV